MSLLPRLFLVLLATLLAAPLWAAQALAVCDMPGVADRAHASGDGCCAPAVPVVVTPDAECCLSDPSPPAPDGPCFRCDVPLPTLAVDAAPSLAWAGLAPPTGRVADLLVVKSESNAGTPIPFIRPPPPTLVGLHVMLRC